MGGICGSDQADHPEPTTDRNDPKKKRKVVIIGAGPAGIHMASILLKKGYTNVCILEKQEAGRENVGKSMTIPDSTFENVNDYGQEDGSNPIVHECGTCYLHPEYFVIHDLIEKYDPKNEELRIPSRALFFANIKDENEQISMHAGDESKIDKNKRDYKEGTSFSAWVLSEAERLTYPKDWHWLPDIVSGGAAWTKALLQYNNLHEDIFGKQKKNKVHGFLNKPKNLELINMTFLQWLEKNKLRALIPTFVYSQSVQGYGTLDVIPAYYGLFWNTPELLQQIIVNQVKGGPSVTCLSKGFGHLWDKMIEELKINIKYGANITGINRHLDDEKAPIDIKLTIGGQQQTMQCDLLFIAAGMHKLIDHKHNCKDSIIEDVTDLEKEVWFDMEAQTLAATVFEYDANDKDLEEAAALMHPHKIWHADGYLYARRNSAKCLLGEEKYKKLVKKGKIKRARSVGYQYLAREPTEEDKAMLLKKMEEGIAGTGLDNPKILRQEVWDYFPIWTQSGVNKGYPWKVKEEMQGMYKNTFYIGCSVSFESVLNVVEYNNELDYKFKF